MFWRTLRAPSCSGNCLPFLRINSRLLEWLRGFDLLRLLFAKLLPEATQTSKLWLDCINTLLLSHSYSYHLTLSADDEQHSRARMRNLNESKTKAPIDMELICANNSSCCSTHRCEPTRSQAQRRRSSDLINEQVYFVQVTCANRGEESCGCSARAYLCLSIRWRQWET